VRRRKERALELEIELAWWAEDFLPLKQAVLPHPMVQDWLLCLPVVERSCKGAEPDLQLPPLGKAEEDIQRLLLGGSHTPVEQVLVKHSQYLVGQDKGPEQLVQVPLRPNTMMLDITALAQVGFQLEPMLEVEERQQVELGQ
jgi:hypothetical protein